MSSKNSWQRIVKQTVFISAAALAFWAGTVHADTTYTWSGAVTGETWSTNSTNWDGASGNPWDVTSGTSNTATFNTSFLNATVSGTVYTNGITFSAAGTLSGGTINLAGTTPTITTTNDATISSVLNGTSGLIKSGTGTLTLTSLQNYSGSTRVAEGMLKLVKTQPASGSIGIQFQGGGVAIGENTAGVVPMTHWNTFSGNSLGTQSNSLKDSNGTARTATLDSFVAPDTYYTTSSNPLLSGYLDNTSLNGKVEVKVSGILYPTYDVYAYFGSNATEEDGYRTGSVQLDSGVTYYYTTRGNASDYLKATTTDKNAPDYSSANYAVWRGVTGAKSFTVNQYYGNNRGEENNSSGLHGIEIVNTTPAPAANFLPTATALSIVAADATLDLGGTSQQVASLSGSGSIINSSTDATSILTLSPTGSLTTFSGGILGGGNNGVISLVKSGDGTLVLSGTNSYTGGTTVTAGKLILNSSTALPDGTSLTIGAGGVLIFDPSTTFESQMVGDVSGATSVISVPEPGSLTLLIAGLSVGFGLWQRRRDKIQVPSPSGRWSWCGRWYG